MINGLHHVALSTPDLDRICGFYCGALGFEIVFQTAWDGEDQMDELVALKGSASRVAMLRGGNLYIEVFEYRKPDCLDPREMRRANDRGLVHFALDVTDVRGEYERLKAAGMVFHCEPKSFFDGRIVTVYGRDPDGNILELQELCSTEVPFHLQHLPPTA